VRAAVRQDADLMVEVNLADPALRPNDEHIGERFRRAASDGDRKHRESLAGLRVEIARLRIEARRRVATVPR
jgi:hypothetical protein